MSSRVGLATSGLLPSANGEGSGNDDVSPLAAETNSHGGRRGTGRVRHDEKITVYVSADELVALEQARLTLRARHGIAVDRGRIVREAIAAMLADLETSEEDSELIRRLSAS
jgi:hypothetical protein